MKPVHWIGVDWGTTNLRVFAIGANGCLIAEKSSDQGMAKLQAHEFEPALLSLIAPWLSNDCEIQVFACGMVGAKQGWHEASYCGVPCPPVTVDKMTFAPTKDRRMRVHILPGLSQAAPADVMRGEETQIAGLLAQSPDYSGAVCLPGTHSKWVSVAGGKVTNFTTYMTGELFDVIAGQTILRHFVDGETWDNPAFLTAARRAVCKPHLVTEELFGLRATFLLDACSSTTLRSRLSGMLIGQELGLSKRYWTNRTVALIGSNATVPLYQQVLQDLDCKIEAIDAQSASLAGLSLIASKSLGGVDHA